MTNHLLRLWKDSDLTVKDVAKKTVEDVLAAVVQHCREAALLLACERCGGVGWTVFTENEVDRCPDCCGANHTSATTELDDAIKLGESILGRRDQ